MLNRRRALKISLAAAVGSLSLTCGARPQHKDLDWPSKAIRIIEPFPPGFGRDPRSRQIAEKLTGIFGQQVYVENRPGAAGRIAGQAVVSAAPDGYTFNMMGTTDLLTKYLYRLSYDLERDLVPVSMIQTVPGVILVRPPFRPRPSWNSSGWQRRIPAS